MQPIKHAIISAAGLGSRLGMDLPKCLLSLGQHKLIYYQLQLLADVENVSVVVGFREHEVMEYVSSIRSDVLFVRNPHYMETSTVQSIYLACRYLKEPFIMIDGDLLIEPKSCARFLRQCAMSDESIVCYTKYRTSDPVFVQLDQSNKMVTEFQRDPATPYEWCGVAYLTENYIVDRNCHLYHQLETRLPLKSHYLDCYEIDTPEDLNYIYANNEAWIKTLLATENEQPTTAVTDPAPTSVAV